MRFAILLKADCHTEAAEWPGTELRAAMGRYNEDLVKAGVLLAADGLHPTSRGARVRFSNGGQSVVDGPFANSGDLIAGLWMLQVKSLDEAIEWVKRCPSPPTGDAEIEIRRVLEAEDVGADCRSGQRAAVG